MTRPYVSDELTQVIEEIHREQTGEKPTKFEDALKTVVQLANKHPEQEGWYPGKYAEQTVNRLLGHNTPSQSSTETGEVDVRAHPPELQLNPDTQAVFKQSLDDDYTLTIPEAERMALDISPGDIMQVITYPSESAHGEIID